MKRLSLKPFFFFLGLFLFFGIGVVIAAPSQGPEFGPGVSLPLTVGDQAQTKEGSLIILGSLFANRVCLGSTCRSSWASVNAEIETINENIETNCSSWSSSSTVNEDYYTFDASGNPERHTLTTADKSFLRCTKDFSSTLEVGGLPSILGSDFKCFRTDSSFENPASVFTYAKKVQIYTLPEYPDSDTFHTIDQPNAIRIRSTGQDTNRVVVSGSCLYLEPNPTVKSGDSVSRPVIVDTTIDARIF